MKIWSPEELQRVYLLSRNAVWRYKLDQYEEEAIKNIVGSLRLAILEIESRIANAPLGAWRAVRSENLLIELDSMLGGARMQLTSDIADVASHAGEWAAAEHGDIASMGGKVPGFNSVSLSADQFRQFFVSTPMGGSLLAEWTAKAFDVSTVGMMRQELNAGVLQGEGYRKLFQRVLDESMTPLEREAITLVRTYVQSANVAAQEAVYARNRDVVKGVEWNAALEPGYKSTGRGTCLRCAALDGQTWDLDESRPDCPLHPRCRCCLLPAMKSWRELGVPIDEIESAARPYVVRTDRNIDAGGRRAIIEQGWRDGDYGTWFAQQGEAFRMRAAGEGRFELLDSGRVKFHDLVDRETGRLLRLDELGGNGPGSLVVRTPMEGENLLRDITLTEKDKAALSLYTGEGFRAMNYALRKKSGLSPESKMLSRDLSAVLKKMPQFRGMVYRGMRFGSKKQFESYAEFIRQTKKKTDLFEAFVSTSTRLDVAKHYAGDGYRVLYTIFSKRGRYLGGYSAPATTSKSITEREVLFDKQSRFTIQSVRIDGNTLLVTLKEKI